MQLDKMTTTKTTDTAAAHEILFYSVDANECTIVQATEHYLPNLMRKAQREILFISSVYRLV